MSQSPSVALSEISPQHVSSYTTVSVSFGLNTQWLSSLTLEINTCVASVMTVEGSTCDQLPTTSEYVEYNVSTSPFPVALYLLPGSVLNVTLLETASESSELWIIKSIETYLLFNGDGLGSSPFSLFQCGNKRQDAQCYKASEFRGQTLPPYVVTSADYYSIAGRPLPVGSFIYSYLNNSYDIQAIRERYALSSPVFVGPSAGARTILIAGYLDFSPKCVLLLTNCDSTSRPSEVSYIRAERRQDILIVPGILSLLICLVYVGIVSCAHFICVKRKVKNFK